MQLLIQLPRLPFSIAFDILFRHGGFAAFANVHGPEALYQFWRMYFVSSPLGKINSARIGQWVEVMCACHIVRSLAHPAHAVYLLRPVCHNIPESVSAWAVAGGRGNQMLSPEILIRAMKVFLPRGHQPLLQREWFWVSEVFYQRSLRGWMEYVDEVISNHYFTQYWWNGQKECPFYLLDGAEGLPGLSMDRVILGLVERETLTLRQSLKREETAKMMRTLQELKWKKESNVERGSQPSKTNGKNIQSNSKQHQRDQQSTTAKQKVNQNDITIKKKLKPPTLTSANKQEIDRLTQLRYTEHTSILSQVKSALASMLVVTLDENFRRVLGLVVSLGHKYQRIKWNLKLALHMAAFETGRSTWEIERELYCVRYRRDVDPLAKLAKLSTEGKSKGKK